MRGGRGPCVWLAVPGAILASLSLSMGVPAAGCGAEGSYGGGGRARAPRGGYHDDDPGPRPRRSAPSVAEAGDSVPLSELATRLGARYLGAGDVRRTLRAALDAACPGGGAPIDLVLVLDSTGSMGEILTEVTEAADVLRDAPPRGCRVAIFEFRDAGDTFVVRRVRAFADAPDALLAALRGIESGGGGDYPEAALAALDQATAYAAGAGRPSVVVLVSDAASHEDAAAEARVRARVAGGMVALTILDVGGAPSDTASAGARPRRPRAESGAAWADGAKDAAEAAPDTPPAPSDPTHRAATALGAEWIDASGPAQAAREARAWLALLAASTGAAKLDVLIVADERVGALAAAPGAGAGETPLVTVAPTGLAALAALLTKLRDAGARVGLVTMRSSAYRVVTPVAAGAPAVADSGLPAVWTTVARAVRDLAWEPGRRPVCIVLLAGGGFAAEPAPEAELRAWRTARDARLVVIVSAAAGEEP
jgi:hypothetical protein